MVVSTVTEKGDVEGKNGAEEKIKSSVGQVDLKLRTGHPCDAARQVEVLV